MRCLLCLLTLLVSAWPQAVPPGPAVPSCWPLSQDRILGSDLSAAVPQLAALPPDLVVGYSPTPGVPRIFLASELRKLSLHHGLPGRFTDPVCFAWPLHQLTKEAITAALVTSFAGRDVQAEIVDQCRNLVPEGEVVFPLQSLSAATAHPAFWNGYIRYAQDKRFSTWIQVRLTVREKQVIATRPIRAGAVIDGQDLETTNYTGPLRWSSPIHEESEIKGKSARQPIPAGAVFSEALLSAQLDVERQQIVTVHIDCGAAHIETQGIAVEAGERGAVIKVRNVKTGRVFLARIDKPGVVTVVPGRILGLVVEEKKS